MTTSPARTTGRIVDADLLRQTAELAIDFLSTVDERPVGNRAGRDELLRNLDRPLEDEGVPAARVVDELAAGAEPGLLAIPGPRYFGFVIGGSLPAALAADWLTSAWDQNAGLFACAPAGSVAEEVAARWLIELLGLPDGTSVGFTTGCQMAHLTCLAAARHAVLERAGWNVEDDGLMGAPPIEVIASSQAHATVGTALQYLGLGRSRTTLVDVDDQGRVQLEGLEAVLTVGDPDRPTIVNLLAGNIATGAFDAMGDAIDLVHRHRQNAWVHVDGAFGLWAAATPAYRHLLAGFERADSWATDGHKWLNVPYDGGFALVRDAEAHRAAMSPPVASYIVYGSAERDPFHWVPEYSRRARGFATYAAIRSLGRQGVAAQIERGCRMASRMADALRTGGPRVELVNDVVLDQVLVRFHPPGTDPSVPADGEAIDAYTREVIGRVQDDGTCWLAGTTWQGRAAMRVSIVNWATNEEDIDRSAAAILRSAEAG